MDTGRSPKESRLQAFPPFMRRMRALPRILFLLIGLGTVLFNGGRSWSRLEAYAEVRARRPYVFLGRLFEGLGPLITPVRRIGYYTDLSLDDQRPAMELAQAQYATAPVILDPDSQNYPWIVLHCSTTKAALRKMRESGWIPVKRNAFGVFLARNPSVPIPTRP